MLEKQNEKKKIKIKKNKILNKKIIMQSSPYHSNKLFDNRFSMMNVPKSSSECPWKLVKEMDPKTGSFVYKLVNSEHESINTKSTENEEKPVEETPLPEKKKVLKIPEVTKNSQKVNIFNKPIKTETVIEKPKEEPVVDKVIEASTEPEVIEASTETEVVEASTEIVEASTEPEVVEENSVVPEKEELVVEDSLDTMRKMIEEKTLLLSQSILKQVPSHELLFENYASFEFGFSSFRSKSRNYMLTHFPPYITRTYTKDIQNISKNSRIIDFRNNHLVKIDQAIILINGQSVYLKEKLNASLSFKFIRSSGLKHNVYHYTTSKIKLDNNDGNFCEQIVTNIDSFLPLSNQNIYTYIPILQIHKENENEGDYELTIKVVLRTSKVPIDSLDIDSLSYLPKDSAFAEK